MSSTTTNNILRLRRESAAAEFASAVQIGRNCVFTIMVSYEELQRVDEMIVVARR